MTKETWNKFHETEYVGKHAPKKYRVWRVLGPAGPEQIIYIEGFDKAKELTLGCWDAEVTSEDGRLVYL